MTSQAFVLTQRLSDIPEGDSWLSPQEAARAAGMRFAKRRSDWLLGRWTAKIAVQRYLSTSGTAPEFPSIEIRSAPDGAPDVYVSGQAADLSLSLSHSSGTSLVAISTADAPIGCDIERIEPRSPEFLLDYFTEAERTFAEAGAEAELALRCTLVWSAKESALKWLREGLRVDTRSVRVSPGDPRPAWSPLRVTCDDRDLQLIGWWRQDRNLVETLVGQDLLAPIPLA